MACGTPVSASNTSSLPEVLGDGGYLVAPRHKGQLVSAMKELLSTEEMRRTFVEKGKIQAGYFTWRKCAEETLKVYQEAEHSLRRRNNE
jgi:glycosyltransferase involved in cell wall biosynthesis